MDYSCSQALPTNKINDKSKELGCPYCKQQKGGQGLGMRLELCISRFKFLPTMKLFSTACSNNVK